MHIYTMLNTDWIFQHTVVDICVDIWISQHLLWGPKDVEITSINWLQENNFNFMFNKSNWNCLLFFFFFFSFSPSMPFNMMVVALMLSLIFFSTPYITYNKFICLLEKQYRYNDDAGDNNAIHVNDEDTEDIDDDERMLLWCCWWWWQCWWWQ